MTIERTTPTALVTGASQGLGLALTRELAARGWHVVVDARDPRRLFGVIHDLPNVTALPGDVTHLSHRGALSAAVGSRLDLLVCNASTLGASPLPRLTEVPLEVLRRTFEVNVVAPLALVQQVLPALQEGHGTVVTISSDAALGAYEGWGVYGASKAALDQVTNVLRAEHPELRVLAIDPGDMRTRTHQDAFPGEDISDRPLPEIVVPWLLDVVQHGSDAVRHVRSVGVSA